MIKNWPRHRARFFFKEIDERAGARDLPLLSVSAYRGVIPKGEAQTGAGTGDLSLYKVVDANDLVINRMSAYQGALGRAPLPGIVSPEYMVLRPTDGLDPRFFAHLAKSRWFVAEMTSRLRGIGTPDQGNVRTPRVNAESVGNIRIPLPDLGQQQAIADLLDRETARLDALVARKGLLLGAVTRRQEAWLERLVLGIDRKSGWASSTGFFVQCPSGWMETSIRHLNCEVQTGPFGSQLHAEEYVEGGWPVVNPANLQRGKIVPIPGMTVTGGKRQELERHVLRVGDIVFGRRGEMGRAGLVGHEHLGWLCGTGSVRLRLQNSPLTPHYLKLLLETQALRTYFELSSIGSTMDNLNSEVILGLPCLVPPKPEQIAIAATVTKRARAMHSLRARMENQIELLREHRQALVTAAVTGQIDIPSTT